jgi:hypothetical protein
MTEGCYNKNCPYPGCLGLSEKNPCDAYIPPPKEEYPYNKNDITGEVYRHDEKYMDKIMRII